MKKLLSICLSLVCACSLQAQGGLYPLNSWFLHPGLNASLSFSAFTSFKGGSGFSNSLSVAYADSLTSRLTYAVGGYVRHTSWGGRSFSDAGLTAMLNYQFDDHLEGTLFAQKSLAEPSMLRSPMMPYWMREEMADKIGAELRYHFDSGLSLGVGVSMSRIELPEQRFHLMNVHQPSAAHDSHQPPASYGGGRP